MAERITVNIPDGTSYDIIIEKGLLAKLDQHADELGFEGRVVVGTNTTLLDLYADKLASWLPSADIATMHDGEQYKNLDTVRGFYDEFLAFGADRHTAITAFGGGVVGDTVGFVAATYMRGVRFVQIPTSLLAMVDSSVGGKVGVDLPQGKNLVGAFKQPQAVLIDTSVLDTLPDEQWRCGMGEIIKHGLLADEGLLDTSLHTLARAEELVSRAIKVKVDVVQQDPYEQGIRAHLNLGHTFAHAIERVTDYAWQHGDAVGFGLLAAAKLSHELGMIDADLVRRVRAILAQTGFPLSLNGLDPDAIYNAMTTDKKWKNGVSRFILLDGMCQARIVTDVPRATVTQVLSGLQ
jgi:3-dehydroquinate synthase